jgi:hypothetical protein
VLVEIVKVLATKIIKKLTNETYNYYLREFMVVTAAVYLKNARKLKICFIFLVNSIRQNPLSSNLTKNSGVILW